MDQSILVTGATGKLGRLIVQRLLDLGQPVRALTRRPDVADALFGRRVEIAQGDFADQASLDRAFTSVDRLLLLSPIGEQLAHHQIAAIEAAERAGVRRIVKISGSHWTVEPAGRSISGAAHAAVESRLASGSAECVALRPSAWMQVSLPIQIARIKEHQPLSAGYGDAAVAFIDAHDIADVAVQQLLADRVEPSPLVLTGGSALSINDIARIASRLTGETVPVVPARKLQQDAEPSFEQRAVTEFMVLIGEGRAGATTNTVRQVLARPPRTVEAFLTERLELVPA